MSYAYSPHSSSRSRKLRYLAIALAVLGVGGFFGYRSWSRKPAPEELSKMVLVHVRECTWELDGEKVDGRRLKQQKPARTMEIEITEADDREVQFLVLIQEKPNAYNPAKRIAGAPLPTLSNKDLARDRQWIYAGKWKFTPPGLRGLFTRGSLDGTIDEERTTIAVTSGKDPTKTASAAAPGSAAQPVPEAAAPATPAATPFVVTVATTPPPVSKGAPKSTPARRKPIVSGGEKKRE